MTPGTCIHFTGLIGINPTCKAGIEYIKEFDNSRPGLFLRMPCVQYRVRPAHGKGTYVRPGEATIREEIDRRGETMFECPHFCEPSPEAIEASRREMAACLAKTMAAIEATASWRVKGVPPKARRGVVKCPICQGNLHLVQSAVNGHCSGKCETPGCVEWME